MKVVLKKSELTEGITPELVQSINIKKQSSPIQVKPGDDPVNLMPCEKGFWVKLEDRSILTDENNKYVVISHRDAIVGRARYLLNFSAVEKEQKATALAAKWKEQVAQQMNEIKKAIDLLTKRLDPKSMVYGIAAARAKSDADFANSQAFDRTRLEELTAAHSACVDMVLDGRWIELITVFKVFRFSDLMLTVNFDNPADTKTLINIFSASAIDKWDGDMLIKYAQIEVEKEYLL